MLAARAKRTFPLILGLIAGALAMAIAFLIDSHVSSRWICVALFGAGAVYFLYYAVWPPIVIQIKEGRIQSGGHDYALADVKTARIVKYSTTTGVARCLQIELHDAPRRSALNRILSRLGRIGMPKVDCEGKLLAKEPTISVGLPRTDIPDAD